MKDRKSMTDEAIVALYWARAESAIAESDRKYGTYLRSIAYNIVYNTLDTEECVNDTYLDAWNTMPPHKPSLLSTFLGKITRRISIDRFRRSHADKRGGGEMPLVLDELSDCASADDVETTFAHAESMRLIRGYLDAMPVLERRIFLRRYWYFEPIADIADAYGFSVSKTTSILCRTRKKLRTYLESEGYL